MNSDQPPDPDSLVSDPWTITAQTSEEADMIARLKRAGVLPTDGSVTVAARPSLRCIARTA